MTVKFQKVIKKAQGKILDAAENIHDRELRIWDSIRSNPNFSRTVIWSMIIAGVVMGTRAAIKIYAHSDKVVTNIISPDKDIIDAKNADKLLTDYYADILVGLTELETYRETPKLHQSEVRHTNGLGLTWTYAHDDNGNITKTANNKKTRARTRDENYDQVRLHLTDETIPKIKMGLKNRQITARQAVAVVLAGYQRLSDVYGIVDLLDRAETPQAVADAFDHFYTDGKRKMADTFREGTLKRRWICAAYATGAITTNDLKKMSRDAFSMVEINNVYRNGHFLLDPQTVSYVLNQEGRNNSVQDFLTEFDTGRQILASITPEPAKTINYHAVDMAQGKIEQSMALLNQGIEKYKGGDYVDAAKLFDQAILQDPDNMQAYSDLALCYKKLGDLNQSIAYYEKSTDIVVQCNMRMNANRSLLMDHRVKAMSYYNAGSAREGMGRLYARSKDKKKSTDNYIMALRNYETALWNYTQVDDDDKQIVVAYHKAINRMCVALGKDPKYKIAKGADVPHLDHILLASRTGTIKNLSKNSRE